jgi:Na+/H+-dicarboxylate symporter
LYSSRAFRCLGLDYHCLQFGFNSTGIPAGFEHILAIDWFMDRFRTTLLNVINAVVCAIVAHLAPLEEMEDFTKAARHRMSQAKKNRLTTVVEELKLRRLSIY